MPAPKMPKVVKQKMLAQALHDREEAMRERDEAEARVRTWTQAYQNIIERNESLYRQLKAAQDETRKYADALLKTHQYYVAMAALYPTLDPTKPKVPS